MTASQMRAEPPGAGRKGGQMFNLGFHQTKFQSHSYNRNSLSASLISG